ncbi:hypothetical protein [Sphingomonas sp. SUN039]|uniref:hypothetical protein n=1 Tax=Sphingomonas sp. SUN039 TaxID=2937787 RepID=UPI002164A30B|nr:hypothetical protein [Sphingomonas sp. SUN039]UVO54091.1 hypothetical protein M0209_08125 [Sphingomonas sp. SUN039]
MLEEARAASPDDLARRFLPRASVRIVKAIVSPNGMDAPLPWVTSIQLFEAPVPSEDREFCATRSYVIDFATINPATAMEPQPAAPKGTRVQSYARWVPDSRLQGVCDAPLKPSFAVDTSDRANALTLVRNLAALWIRARRGKRLALDLAFADEYADQLDRYQQSRIASGQVRTAVLTQRFASPLAAFREFPIDEIAYVDPLRGVLFAGGLWEAEVKWDGRTVTALTLKRRIPPPF